MPNAATFSALVDTATKCFATAAASPPSPASDQSRAVCALVIVSSVVKVFDEMTNSVSAASRSGDGLGEVGAVDIGHEAERHRTVAVVLQRLVGHHRSQVGAADADVDHVADALARMSLPRAAADAVREIRHPVEHGMDVGHHVLPVDDDRRASRRAQCHMQHRAILGMVDPVAAKHGVDARTQTRLGGQLQQ